MRNQSSSKWVSNVGESRTSGWAGSSTCGSNRAPSKRIPRARSISPRQPVHEGPHRPLDARLRPEEKTRQVPLAVQGDRPHLLHHRVGEPPLELRGHPCEVSLPSRHRLREIRGHPPRHFAVVGVKPLVRRGPDLGLEVVAEKPELPSNGAEAAALARERRDEFGPGGIGRPRRAFRQVQVFPAPGDQRMDLVTRDLSERLLPPPRDPVPQVLRHFLAHPLEAGTVGDGENSPRLPRPGGRLAPGEFDHRRELFPGHQVRLRQQDGRLGSMQGHVVEKQQVVFGKGMVDADGDEGRPDARHPVSRHPRVVGEDAAQPRRVDEPDSLVRREGGKFHVDHRHPLFVRGFPRSVTNSASRAGGISNGSPERPWTVTRSLCPYPILVTTAVDGRTSTGTTAPPISPLRNELFPALNCPRTATSTTPPPPRSSSHAASCGARDSTPNFRRIASTHSTAWVRSIRSPPSWTSQ